ncbi:MAG: thrombospondin type 3 repeat-containing protein [Verrucomicrobiota bacterium]|nr:thrombospondin type 3 repeat-containing protein [Verrucomicrobiota bacterium]
MMNRKDCRHCCCWILLVAFLMVGGLLAAPVPLVVHSDPWRFHKGTVAPQADWMTVAEAGLLASWGIGPGGFGYGDGDDATVLTDMRDQYSTLYLRAGFELPDDADLTEPVFLVVDYDDAFIAWINGVEIARSANAPGAVGTEPAYSELAEGNHEAAPGGGAAPTYINLGPAQDLFTTGEGILALMGLNVSSGSSDFTLKADLLLGAPAVPETSIVEDTRWVFAESPYLLPETVTVEAGATLTIEPGVVIQLGAGRDLVIRGRLVAEGTEEQRIRFTGMDDGLSWGRIDFLPNTLEQRLVCVDIAQSDKAGNVRAEGARLFLESVIWSETDQQLLAVDDTALIVRNCVFPGISSQELVHFDGMPADGYADFVGNWFGPTTGYSDIVDFTGGKLPGPIARFIGNVFTFGVDDGLDFDGTDALIEGNIFMRIHQDAARSSSSNAIATGERNGHTAHVMIARNIIFDCDHALLLKEGATAVLQNNTIVRIRDGASSSQPGAAINFQESNINTDPGGGALLDGNIIWDLNGYPFTLNYDAAESYLQVRRTIIEGLLFPGDGNSQADPMFARPDGSGDLREAFQLLPGSPAIGTGPNGLDMGALVPAGPTISGEPPVMTSRTSATLKVGGPGIVAFQYAVNRGPYSEEIPIEDLLEGGRIELTDLTTGSYVVSVRGKDFSGVYHEQAVMSRDWFVDTEAYDLDRDGLPTEWELKYGLDPDDPTDAMVDTDGDGYTNRAEFLAGTHPLDPESRLEIAWFRPGSDGAVELAFYAVTGRPYAVQFRGFAPGSVWQDQLVLESVAETGLQELSLMPPAGFSGGYFRVVLSMREE